MKIKLPIGLEGYKFTVVELLNLTIIAIDESNILVSVKDENKAPVTDLEVGNFKVIDADTNSTIGLEQVISDYDEKEQLIYRLVCNCTVPTPVVVEVWSPENIHAIAKYSP